MWILLDKTDGHTATYVIYLKLSPQPAATLKPLKVWLPLISVSILNLFSLSLITVFVPRVFKVAVIKLIPVELVPSQ